MRNRVGATLEEGVGSLVELDPWLDSELGRSRFEGEGGIPSSSESLAPSSASASKSNIFAKSRPTFGELTNRSSAGAGVARGCPVCVRITPFIAEGAHSGGRVELRLTGVSTVTQSRDVRCSRIRQCSSVRGASKFFISSKGALSLRPDQRYSHSRLTMKMAHL